MNNCLSNRHLGSRVLILVATALAAALPSHGSTPLARKVSFVTGNIQSGFFQPYQNQTGGVGFGLSATWDGAPGTVNALIRYDNNGTETGNAEMLTGASSHLASLFGIPDVPTRFWATSMHETGHADIGLFNFSDLSSVFTRRLTIATDAANTSILAFSNNRIGVLQDAGSSIKVSLFDATTGSLAFEQTYTSTAFLASGGLLSGQSAAMTGLPDGSGYVLVVSSYELDLGGGGTDYDSSIVIAYLSTTGTVLATTRLQMTSGGPVIAVPSVLPDNSVLINALVQSVDPVTFAVTTQNHLFNIRSNGTLKWAKIYGGASLFAAQSQTATGDLYLSGSRDTSSGQSTTSDGVLARISSIDGSLLNQANIDRGELDSVLISGSSSNAVFATATVVRGSPGTSRVTLLKLPLNLSAVSTAVEYARDVNFAFYLPVAANAELILSTFENSKDVGAITLTENFGATLNCALLTPVVVPVTNPGVTVANSTVTPVAVVVNAASSVPVTSAATFSLSHTISTTSDICTVAAAAPVISSALTASSTVGAAFTYTITASNSPTSYNATGLPAGLSVNTSTGAITGTPTTAAVTNVTISATNGTGTGQATLQVTINSATPTAPTITTQPVDKTVTAPAPATFTVTANGTPLTFTYTWQRKPAGSATFGNLSNGGGYSGVTTATLTVDPTSLAMSGDQFRCLVGNTVAPDATSNAATLTVNASTSRLINLSVRTGAGTGSQTLIVGFVVGGTGTNQVLLRGIGPTLSLFGVAGVLADPQLRIYSGNTLLQENDDWGGGGTLSTAFSSVSAFALTGASKDAAMLATLNSGPYTTHCSSTAGTGIALVELYDMLAPGSTARLINVSARTQVNTGDDILIVGFAIAGVAPKTLLIRGIGPTLGAFGVGGVLADPQLALYSGSTVVQSNDNWGGTAGLTTAFNTVFAFDLPAGSQDAAILVTLSPGTYTAQVSGVGATTGVALVEVYEMP